MRKTIILRMLVTALCVVISANESVAAPMSTAFSYQGRLIDSDSAADGLYDLQFRLYDDPNVTDGDQVGETVDINDLDVIDGYFTVLLDFNSPKAFNGEARWLDITVRPGDSNNPKDYITLAPRQEITPAPYALHSASGATDSPWRTIGSDIYYDYGNVGIGTSSPGATLDVRGMLNVGVDGAGHDVTFFGSESGGKMFWDESKMALRSGIATGAQWDDANIGEYSTAIGFRTKASARSSIALGRETEATHICATAMGSETTASGIASTAMGNGTSAGGSISTAIGNGTTASGTYSTAMGAATIASDYVSTAMGSGTNANGYISTAMGSVTTASGTASTSMGSGTNASGHMSTAMGSATTASGSASTSMGNGTSASGSCSTAMGNYTEAGGYNSIAMGKHVTAGPADNTIAIGTGIDYQNQLVNNKANSLMVGFGSTTPTLFVDGESVGIGKTNPGAKLHVSCSNSPAAVIGAGKTKATGVVAVALGADANAVGNYSIAMGTGSIAGGMCSTAIGTDITVSGNRSVGVGIGISRAEISSDNVMAIMGGKVGVGTASPVYELDVNGDIRATGSVYYGGAEGDANGTAYDKPDYVFEEGYDVISTDQVEEYLKKENHLPWMTSVKQERRENGDVINVTRMAFETVETVENLQLQIIELNRLIKKQAGLIEIQQNRIKALEETAETTESIIQQQRSGTVMEVRS